jgi:hypothetical protein
MKLRTLLATLPVVAALAIPTAAPAFAQQPKERLYAFHSAPTGACPAMDWHVVLGPDNSLAGFIAWDGMKHLAKVSGTLQTGRVFHLDAMEEGGMKRKGTVSGRVEDSFIVASLQGTRTGCDNQQISVPYFASGLTGGGG